MEPLPPEFGGVLYPGQNISFPGGNATISNYSIIVRPDMIHSCSTRDNFVRVFEDKIDSQNLEIGNPIISLLIDIRDLPNNCPIITGIINNITRITTSIVEIGLGDMDITKMFMHADIEIINATLYDAPTGDESIDDMIATFNITADTNLTATDDNITSINVTTTSNQFDRRRLLTFGASTELTVIYLSCSLLNAECNIFVDSLVLW